jgi:hypothetical protein
VTDLAKDVGKGVWNSKYNPLKDPVDDVISFFGGGNDGPSVHEIIARQQVENERKMVLIRNRAQIEKEYGPAYFSMLMTSSAIPAFHLPQAITDMDQHRQEQQHDAAIENAQKALTGELPGAPRPTKQDEIYPNMVSR